MRLKQQKDTNISCRNIAKAIIKESTIPTKQQHKAIDNERIHLGYNNLKCISTP